MKIRGYSLSAPHWPALLLAVAIAAMAIGGQIVLDPLMAQASYHLLLGAVALGVMLGGVESGVSTLFLCGVGKLFVLAHSPMTLPPQLILAHLVLFGSAGTLICAIGGDVQTTQGRLAAVLNTTGEAIVATDARGLVTFLNPVAEMLTGCAMKSALSKDVASVLQFRDMHSGAPLDNPARHALQHRAPEIIPPHTALESRTGQSYPVAGRVALIRGSPRSVRGAVIVLRDISATNPFGGLLPICARCKRIRDGDGSWRELEKYLSVYAHAVLSHGLCPECFRYYEGLTAKRHT